MGTEVRETTSMLSSSLVTQAVIRLAFIKSVMMYTLLAPTRSDKKRPQGKTIEKRGSIKVKFWFIYARGIVCLRQRSPSLKFNEMMYL